MKITIINFEFVAVHNSTVSEVNLDLDLLNHIGFCKKYNLPTDTELEIELEEDCGEVSVLELMEGYCVNDSHEFVDMTNGWTLESDDN